MNELNELSEKIQNFLEVLKKKQPYVTSIQQAESMLRTSGLLFKWSIYKAKQKDTGKEVVITELEIGGMVSFDDGDDGDIYPASVCHVIQTENFCDLLEKITILKFIGFRFPEN